MAKLSGRLAETGPKKNGILPEKEQTESISLNQASWQEEVSPKNETLESELTKSYEKDLDSVLEKQEKLTDELDKTSFSKNHSELIAKGLESLKNLSEAGEGALKTLSAETVRFFKSNILSVKLRSIYVEKKSISLTKRLRDNQTAVSSDEINSFLKTIKAGFWSKGLSRDDAGWRAGNFLRDLYKEKGELFVSEIASAWPKLISETGKNDEDWDDFLKQEAEKKQEALRVELGGEICSDNENTHSAWLEKIKAVNDDFSAFTLANKFVGDRSFLNEHLLERLDNIIKNYPDLSAVSNSVFIIIQELASANPEAILSNSRRRQFLLNSWLYWNKEGCSQESSSIAPLFLGDLGGYNKSETKKVANQVFSKLRSSSVDDNYRSLMLHLPIEKKDLDKAIKADPDLQYSRYYPLFELKKNSLERGKPGNNEPATSLFEDLLYAAEGVRFDESIVFLSYLINNFPNKSESISEEELAKILEKLLSGNSNLFKLEEIKIFQALLKRRNWSTDLQVIIFEKNKIHANLLNNIITGNYEELAWAKNDPVLLAVLEKSFHERGKDNDKRHHFYNVLEGAAKSSNFDGLVKGYADTLSGYNNEEIFNLFITKQLDKKYLPLFLKDYRYEWLLDPLEEKLAASEISSEDYLLFFESLIEVGHIYNLPNIISKLQHDERLNDERLEIFLEKLSENAARKVSDQQGNRRLGSLLTEDFTCLFQDQGTAYTRKVLETALKNGSYYNLLNLVKSNLSVIETSYPDQTERAEVSKQLLDRLMEVNGSWDALCLYFKNNDFWSVLKTSDRQAVEKNIFYSNLRGSASYLFKLLGNMTVSQQQSFKNIFITSFSVQSLGSDFINLCHSLGSEEFFTCPEISAELYIKLLSDSDLSSDGANKLFNIDIFRKFPEIEKLFINNLSNWPQFKGTDFLSAYVSQENPGQSTLTNEQVKEVSKTTLKSRGLSIPFWRGYLLSDKINPAFYLDKELYEIGLQNVGLDLTKSNPEEIIDFLGELEASEFGLLVEQKINIIGKVFRDANVNIRSLVIEKFYNYNAAISEEAFTPYLSDSLSLFLNCRLNFSAKFNNLLLKTGLEKLHEDNARLLCAHFKANSNTEALELIKSHINSLPKKESSWKIKKVLFDFDLMDVKESKSLYKEVISKKGDIRQQILNSIDIIGSMLSNDENIKRLGNFFDAPSPERVKDLENIAAFIRLYPKENKGRTIVTMLFAREYLPERSLEEVVDKVARNLNKYGQILEHNSYRNIPEGVKTSIGMEYEITDSTAKGYKELTNGDLAADIKKLSVIARIGSGKDAVHEIATRPTDNPYLMLLEMKLLNDLEYIDFNFNRSSEYQKGARGFHLTLGGETGLTVDRDTHFLQNVIAAASWGGVMAGETGHKVNGGRGVSLRGRGDQDNNNIAFFEKKAPAVELRSLTIDTQETLQRAVTTAFNGAIAIQACRHYINLRPSEMVEKLKDDKGREELNKKISLLKESEQGIINSWLDLITETMEIVKSHNESFLERESYGYMDDKNVWIESDDFNGRDNKDRFEAIVNNIDPTLSLEEYCQSTAISEYELFSEFSLSLSDKLININNLFIKPGVKAIDKNEEGNINTKTRVFKGDHANAISVLKSTKLDNLNLEYKDEDFLKKTIFDTAGDKREGYYNFQGGSERMITHAIQKALIKFNREIEKIVH